MPKEADYRGRFGLGVLRSLRISLAKKAFTNPGGAEIGAWERPTARHVPAQAAERRAQAARVARRAAESGLLCLPGLRLPLLLVLYLRACVVWGKSLGERDGSTTDKTARGSGLEVEKRL